MTAHLTPPAGGAPPAQLALLAREVERLRARIEALVETPARVDALARLVAQLADTVTALTSRADLVAPPSWLMLPTDPAAARAVLDALTGWMARVYLRYSDAAEALPQCWCWHPDVIEELLWLMHAWLGAYQGRHASVQLVGDWHDRLRPGAVRRIKHVAGTCSRENHQTRRGWASTPTAAPQVPALDALDAIAQWWGAARDQAAPEPDPAPEPTRAIHSAGRQR